MVDDESMIRKSGSVSAGGMDDLQDFRCPNCDAAYTVNALFDHHLVSCSSCNTRLTEWNLMTRIYLIDYDHAEKPLRRLIELLEQMGEPEAEDILRAVHTAVSAEFGY